MRTACAYMSVFILLISFGWTQTCADESTGAFPAATVHTPRADTLQETTADTSLAAKDCFPLQISIITPLQLAPKDTPVCGARLNIVYGYNNEVQGLDLGMINSAGTMNGVQLGLFNYSDNNITGTQLGLINSSYNMTGFQLGLINGFGGHLVLLKSATPDAGRMTGVQLGLLNVFPGHVKGVQIGIINGCKHLTGLQIGIGNVISGGGNRLLPYFPFINFGWY